MVKQSVLDIHMYAGLVANSFRRKATGPPGVSVLLKEILIYSISMTRKTLKIITEHGMLDSSSRKSRTHFPRPLIWAIYSRSLYPF